MSSTIFLVILDIAVLLLCFLFLELWTPPWKLEHGLHLYIAKINQSLTYSISHHLTKQINDLRLIFAEFILSKLFFLFHPDHARYFHVKNAYSLRIYQQEKKANLKVVGENDRPNWFQLPSVMSRRERRKNWHKNNYHHKSRSHIASCYLF